MNNYWRKNFSWSNSKGRMWQECQFSFYYNYVAKYDYFKGDPKRKLLEKLINLEKLYFFKGRLIHDTIKNQIMHFSFTRPMDYDAAKNYFLLKFKEVKENPNQFITESYNGFKIEENEFLNLREDALHQIENFFLIIWPHYKDAQLKTFEEKESFYIDGTKIWLVCDLVTEKKDGTIIITDWKTGKESKDDESQVSLYILWATQKYNIDVEKVKAEIVFLKSCQFKFVEKKKQALEDLKIQIKKKIDQILSVKEESQFSPYPSRNCRSCNFATICPEGKKILCSLL